MVERSVHIGKVRGPIPLATTMYIKSAILIILSFTLTLCLLVKPDVRIAYFDNQTIIAPPAVSSPILGDTTNPSSTKRIEVNLTEQKVYAYENNQLIYSFLISSGKWGRTHPGTYQIWSKVRSQKMSGGSRENGTYYYLPNVPYIMFFYNSQHPKSMGYSFHGTYWHNNFGYPMSHGCVNMKTPEAGLLYQWAEIGTPITIYGKFQYPQASR